MGIGTPLGGPALELGAARITDSDGRSIISDRARDGTTVSRPRNPYMPYRQVKLRMAALVSVADELRDLHHDWVALLIKDKKIFGDASSATRHFRQWLIDRRKTNGK